MVEWTGGHWLTWHLPLYLLFCLLHHHHHHLCICFVASALLLLAVDYTIPTFTFVPITSMLVPLSLLIAIHLSFSSIIARICLKRSPHSHASEECDQTSPHKSSDCNNPVTQCGLPHMGLWVFWTYTLCQMWVVTRIMQKQWKGHQLPLDIKLYYVSI